ncbi:MAG TPA: ABC transporter permease [Candidatus Limnocylindria bacterium]|nr:ABC transporter permease [Candidatus Limnocylindria bacterium]
MSDLGTVMWREWRSLVVGGRLRQSILSVLPALILPVFGPLQLGPRWVTDPILPVLLVVATALVTVHTMIPDAFAGERERRTLATLLASRLPDRAILAGKMAVPVFVDVVLTILLLGLSLLIVNVLHPRPEPLLFSPAYLVALPALSMLLAVFTASVGVFISLRSETVQGAQQLLVAVMTGPPIVVSLALMAIASATGEDVPLFERQLAPETLVAIGGVFLLIDVAIVWWVTSHFRRSRLVALTAD